MFNCFRGLSKMMALTLVLIERGDMKLYIGSWIEYRLLGIENSGRMTRYRKWLRKTSLIHHFSFKVVSFYLTMTADTLTPGTTKNLHPNVSKRTSSLWRCKRLIMNNCLESFHFKLRFTSFNFTFGYSFVFKKAIRKGSSWYDASAS